MKTKSKSVLPRVNIKSKKLGFKMNGINQQQTINYRNVGGTQTTGLTGSVAGKRLYIPGFNGEIGANPGTAIASLYSTGKFLPGTLIRWVPTVGFTTTGNITFGFSDNPEVETSYQAGTDATKITIINGLGNVERYPIYQEFTVRLPTNTRRKYFDTNFDVDQTNADSMDRCMQNAFYFYVDGAPVSTAVGNFVYHDHISLEGLHPVTT